MRDIKSCVYRNYGYKLTDDELQKLIDWYQEVGKYKERNELFSAIKAFLAETFPEKTVYIKEEDTSDITVLLSALNDAIKG